MHRYREQARSHKGPMTFMNKNARPSQAGRFLVALKIRTDW